MPPENEGLLDAVNAAITEASPTPAAPPQETPDVTVAPDAGSDGSAGVDGLDSGASDAAGTPEGGDAGAGAPEGEADAAEGDDAAAPGDDKGKAPAKAGEADKAEKPATDAEKPDPLKDAMTAPLPNALKAETKARINTLIGAVKEKTQAFEKLNSSHSYVMNAIHETGSTPEQYSAALNYLKLVNSDNPADLDKAIEVMQMEISHLSRRAGRVVPGVDILEGHDDLRAQLHKGQISLDAAQELAAAREQRKVMQERAQLGAQHQRVTADTQRQEQAHRQALNNVGEELKAADAARFKANAPKAIEQLKALRAEGLPSSAWATTFKRIYNSMPAPAVVAARAAVPPKTPNQPLRANNPAGGQQAPPASMGEAISRGIAAASGR